MGKVADLIGRRFDRLIVIGVVERTPSGTRWLCLCDCGNNVVRVTTQLMRSGRTGCKRCNQVIRRLSAVEHGDSRTALHAAWKAMRQRCTNPRSREFKYYGAKGVKICAEGAEYPAFKAWALAHGFRPGLSIDRREPNGDYCPENCEWVTRSENSRRVHTARLRLVGI